MNLPAEIEQRNQMLAVKTAEFELLQREAKMLSTSNALPERFKGNVADCAIIIEMSERLGMDRLHVSQNLYVVHGSPAFSAKFLIALINRARVLAGQLRFVFTGDMNSDNWGCHCEGLEKNSGEMLTGTTCTIAMAKAEGWYQKKGSKWQTMPEQMLRYRAATFWANAFAPEATFGYMTIDEAKDAQPTEREIYGQADKESSLQLKTAAAEPAAEDLALTDDGVPFDKETGAVSEQQDSESPAFQTLKSKLLAAKTIDACAEVLTNALCKRASNDERAQLYEMVKMRKQAIEAGMMNA